MDFHSMIAKLRKYPTAAAVLVFSAVFSFLLAPAELLRNIDFYLVWVLSVLFALHIWCHFKEDRSYRVSGIVPAWLELIAGTLLLFFCPVREISLIFIMLAVSSYAAGIIFSVKMTGPLVLLLGVAPNLERINLILSDVMSRTFRNIYFFASNNEPDVARAIQEAVPLSNSSLLLWAMLLAVFPLAVYLCKTAYERFSMYCITFIVYFFCDLLRYLLIQTNPGDFSDTATAWSSFGIALILGTAFIAGLLYAVNTLTKKEGDEKK